MNSSNPSSSHVTAGQTSVESELLRVPEITNVTSGTQPPSSTQPWLIGPKSAFRMWRQTANTREFCCWFHQSPQDMGKKLQRRGANGLLFTAVYKWFSWGRLQERISLYYSRPRICFCIAKYVSVNNLCCYYEGRHDRKSKIIRQDSEVAVDIIHKGVIASAWFAQ